MILAHGEAASRLINIVKQAGARLAGVATSSKFQGGGENQRTRNQTESLAVVCSMQEGKIRFR